MDLSVLERIFLFENTCQDAEATYANNPLDAENLTRWGEALLELSQFQEGPNSMKYLRDAISKLEEALEINARRHEALWCLGNAYNSRGFLTPDRGEAKSYFSRATQCYQRALEEDPGNGLYRRSLELSLKTGEQKTAPAPGESPSPKEKGPIGLFERVQVSKKKMKKKKKKNSSDVIYDIVGWAILAVGVIAWMGMAKSHMPTQSSK